MQQEDTNPTRRTVLSGAAALALTASVTSPSRAQTVAATPADSIARGLVFDAGSNPRAGVAGVMVSNGLDVMKTGLDGNWSLPVRDGDSVFVINRRAGRCRSMRQPICLTSPMCMRRPVPPTSGSASPGCRRPAPCPPVSISVCTARMNRRDSTRCCSPIYSRKA